MTPQKHFYMKINPSPTKPTILLMMNVTLLLWQGMAVDKRGKQMSPGPLFFFFLDWVPYCIMKIVYTICMIIT